MTTYGHISAICGNMFSGKSELLVQRLRRVEIARRPFVAFKHALDIRYDGPEFIAGHGGVRMPCVPVRAPADISSVLYHQRPDVVGIDEAQFFDAGIVAVVLALAARGIRVVVAGLDLDYRGRPFGPMPALLAVADDVTKLSAVCARCGADARRSQRLVADAGVVLVGAVEYEPRCVACFEPPAEDAP